MASLLTNFFGSIGTIYRAIYLITLSTCLISRDRQSILFMPVLAGLVAVSQIDQIWNSPEFMMVAHSVAMWYMWLVLMGRHSKTMINLMAVTVLIDLLWQVFRSANMPPNAWNFPYSTFYWQFIVNLLFAVQCYFACLRSTDYYYNENRYR